MSHLHFLYTSLMTAAHTNFKVAQPGFVISTKHPHIVASPDAFVQCDCCGKGVVDIKCQYSIKSQLVSEDGDTRKFLEGRKLKLYHKYLCQVHTQMLVTEKDFCDFVVWTEGRYD